MRKNKLIIIGSGLILSTIVYSSIISLSKSNDHVKGYEHYYNEDGTTEKDGTASGKGVPALAHDTDGSAIKISKNATIDTNLNSIGLFVNKEYSLSEDYVPSDLVEPDVPFSINYSDEKKLMRAEAARALEYLIEAAKDDGYSICGVSGYRSYTRQSSIYNRNLQTRGADYTNRYSAKPGFSEHQTGLAIDVSASSIGNRLSETFGDTEEGKWLADHAHEYGFIIRYPKDKADITGYAYEPWHIRYLGKELATYLYENNLSLEEYYNYTLPVTDDNTEKVAVDVDDPSDIIEDLPTIIEENSDSQKNDDAKDDAPKTDSDSKNNDSNKDKANNNKDNDSSKDKDTTSKKPSIVKKSSTNKKPSADKKPSTDNKPSNGSTSDKNNNISDKDNTNSDKKPVTNPDSSEDTELNDSTNNNTDNNPSNNEPDSSDSANKVEENTETPDAN